MIIAVDFDGTLTKENLYPKIGEANSEAIRLALRLKEEGHRLILWTCRAGKDLEAAVEFCAERGLTFHAVNDHLPEILEKGWGEGPKVYADYYWDDKAVIHHHELARLTGTLEEDYE